LHKHHNVSLAFISKNKKVILEQIRIGRALKRNNSLETAGFPLFLNDKNLSVTISDQILSVEEVDKEKAK